MGSNRQNWKHDSQSSLRVSLSRVTSVALSGLSNCFTQTIVSFCPFKPGLYKPRLMSCGLTFELRGTAVLRRVPLECQVRRRYSLLFHFLKKFLRNRATCAVFGMFQMPLQPLFKRGSGRHFVRLMPISIQSGLTHVLRST